MKESNKKFYMKKLLINENERNEILEKHLSFKKVLEEKLEQTKKGLTLEQVDDVEEANRNILDSALSKKCLSGGEIKTIDGKSVYVKTATKDTPDIIKVGDEIYQYGIHNNLYFTFWVKPKGGNTLTGPYKWKCSQVNAAEEVKNAKDEVKPNDSTNSKPVKKLSQIELEMDGIIGNTDEFFGQNDPPKDKCVKAIQFFYKTWLNNIDVNKMGSGKFEELKGITQLCANYFNGEWSKDMFRPKVRKYLDVLQGVSYGGPSGTSKWRLEKPVNVDNIKRN
jgi:hypothetical protein